MTALERLYNAAVVRVVVLDDAADAVPTAKALLAGGVDVMEITFRTAAAADSITAVAKECPDMFVGAGTVITLEQCKKAVACGAKFIVAPGYSEEVVSWCVENDIAITPGCVTPTEIMAAMSHGLKVVKFFPANVYGGLSAMKALSGPFGGIKFIPTGGVNDKNLAEYISAPFIHAVGGSWLCAKADIAAHIVARELYVLREEGEIHGVFAFILGEDPTYRVIEQGEWLSDAPYGTIHAVASDGQIHGLLSRIVAYCEQMTSHLRIDTHRDNAIMQHVILKNGFTRCGVIHIASGAERIAFEKV